MLYTIQYDNLQNKSGAGDFSLCISVRNQLIPGGRLGDSNIWLSGVRGSGVWIENDHCQSYSDTF